MSEKIHESLRSHFAVHRIVLWYDPQGEMRDVYENFSAPEIEKIELANDELAVKYRVLRREPDTKFLVYSPSTRPPAAENWLLDLEMGNFVFSTDQTAMIIQQLSLDQALKSAIQPRLGFFRNKTERSEPLAAIASPEWGEAALLYGMLSVTSARTKREREALRSSGLDLDSIVVSLTAAEGSDERWRRVVEWKLDELFFSLVEEKYEIRLDSPEPAGILLRLFMGACAYQAGEDRSQLPRRAFLFIDGWRERKSETSLYESISRTMETVMKTADHCAGLPDESLVKLDIFPCSDRELLKRLSAMVSSTAGDLASAMSIARQRSTSYWYLNDGEGRMRGWYDAIVAACLLGQSLGELRRGSPFRASSKRDLWESYTVRLHLIDRRYRSFLRQCRRAGSPSDLALAMERAASTYLNDFLAPLAQRWQSLLDTDASFDMAPRQDTFFETRVARTLREGKRVFVIISDGLRWEAALELVELLEGSGRFKVTAEPMQALVPTYTSHGMAALLPHTMLELDPASAEVRVDGVLPAGIEGRSRHLAKSVASAFGGARACALGSEEFLSLSQGDIEARIHDMSLVYLYSSKIDSSGHNSDLDVPEAVDVEIGRLMLVAKRIAAMGKSTILITADHGFLFSGSARDDEYMLDVPATEGEALRDQRFILGMNLSPAQGLMRIGAPEPAFMGGTSALIAKGLMKIRRKGASGNFIHGGATLQELAIPVIQLIALKKDESRLAAISVLGSRDITTPSLVVRLFQEEPVGGLVRAHRIRIWFETEAGDTISNKMECLCDSSDVEDVNRAFSLSLEFLPVARKHKGRKVLLRMFTVAEGGTLIPLDPVEFKLRQIALDVDLF